MENTPKKASILQNFLGGHAPRPPSWISPLAPYLLPDSHSQNPSLNIDPLHAKNEFYYKGNESIKLIFPCKHQTKKAMQPHFRHYSTWMCLILGYVSPEFNFDWKARWLCEWKKEFFFWTWGLFHAGIQIVVIERLRVKIKIAAVEYFPLQFPLSPSPKKKIPQETLPPKKILQR